MRRALPSSATVTSLLLTLATALLLRAVHGYRPFPSVDDFVYVPLARAAVYPELFLRDLMVQDFVLHAPVWIWAVRLSERWVGLPTLFWLLTMLLSVASVAGAGRLLRTVGGSVFLLPLVAWIAFSGRVNGIMRGQYDGFVGGSFHVQWLALCFLLWAYAAFLERRAVLSGVFLGLTAISHPVVAIHGAFAILVAGVLSGWGAGVVRAGLVAAVVSAPVSIPLVLRLTMARADETVPAAWLVQFGYLFRTPHEFSLEYTTATELVFLVLLVMIGAAGARILLQADVGQRVKALAGMLLAHALLCAAAILVHGPWAAGGLLERSTLPYLLHLSRTSPMLLVVGATLALAAAEHRLIRSPLWWGLVLDVLILLLFPWSPAILLVLLLSALVALQQYRPDTRRWALSGVGIVALVSLSWSVKRDQLEAAVAPPERALYTWVRSSTATWAMFIIPPGFQQFRTYTDRGAYVDFKLYPATTPGLIPEWRRRLEQIAAPDSAILTRRGWPAIPAWDSSYAKRNDPKRIARLLRETGVEYFVMDLASAPPGRGDLAGKELTTSYADAKYRVFSLKRR